MNKSTKSTTRLLKWGLVAVLLGLAGIGLFGFNLPDEAKLWHNGSPSESKPAAKRESFLNPAEEQWSPPPKPVHRLRTSARRHICAGHHRHRR
jgi:hypothetical protein